MPYFKWEGFRTHFRENGDGPLLVILPGNTASSICHSGELDYFGKRFHAVSLDFLGTGLSDRLTLWPTDWHYQAARQTKALLDHINQKDPIIMGTSGGGVIALLTAIHFPEVVGALVVDSCPTRYTQETFQTGVENERERPSPEQVGFWEFAHGDDWESVIKADTDMMGRFVRMGGNWFDNRLEQINCPTLITASRHDNLIQNIVDEASQMSARIKTASLYLSQSGQHPLMWSAPEEFRRVCDIFFDHCLNRSSNSVP